MKLRDIARLLDAKIQPAGRGDDLEIVRVAKIEEAGTGDITFVSNPKYLKFLSTTNASAAIVGQSVSPPKREGDGRGPVLLHVDDPYVSFLKILLVYYPPKVPLPPGIHPTAVVAPTAELGHDVRVGAHAVIGEDCRIAENAMICHGVVLGDGVQVGKGTLLYQNVSVREGCRIGDRVIIQPGVVIGSDGFGFVPQKDGTYEKIPQMGIVVIDDDVEIGANTTIDRATIGETRIGKGVKLDNLVQIAHNVAVGDHTVIAAQTGISGSTRIGRRCIIAGQVGFVGHIEIADNTTIASKSGIHKSVSTPGETWFGYPAHPHRHSLRIQGALTQLPDLLATVRELRLRVEALEQELQERKS